MRFTLVFPMRAVKHHQRWMDGADLGQVARTVEQAGFDGIAVSEHPFPADDWLAAGGHHALDPFVALAVMAGATQRIRLVTHVLVAGYRHPYLTAKALASLDVVSGGRVTAGMAVGYLQSEFDVLGVDFTTRGRHLDAAIPAMRAAWAGTDHDSDLFPAHGHTMLPAPVQPGGPPIWLGGNSRAAQRRAVHLADGWSPISQGAELARITGTPALDSLDDLARAVAGVQSERAALGSPPLEISFSPFEKSLLKEGRTEEFAAGLRARLPAYEDAGVTWLTIEPASRSYGAFAADVERLGEAIASLR